MSAAETPRGGRSGPDRRGSGNSGNRRRGTGGRAAGGARTGGSAGQKAESGTRKRVNPKIQVGTVVAPAEVVERAKHSRLLEVDADGELLTERLVSPWMEGTPENTVLDVRAHRLLTHHAAPIESIWPEVRDTLTPALRERRQLYAEDLPGKSLDIALDRFLASIEPLREFSKLGSVVFPFPSYFTPGPRALDYLEWLRGRSGDLPIAVELRHRDWVAGKQREATMQFLTDHQLSFVGVDVPPNFDSSLPPLTVATTDTAFVRFHGRNAEAWERGVDTGEDRFAYEYHDRDFEPWVPRLEKLAGASRSVHVMFSGRNTEAAARSARLLVRVLSGESVPERKRPAAEGARKRRPPRPR